ncbi:MAG: XRE family transcriptional regulator [Synergistes jonesii]|uniref:helix-turn-helix domain-containing protein n=1 Tax=Synergistes jonesii TaxID=2754 RepID=UPI002A74D3CD|nr:XRE family transcriptional regulator [Synergistes jonesii]MDY2983970.1 XRE family transcriptional regulator [Synergistes jonesii]
MLSDRIKKLRKEKKLTLETVAGATGLSKGYLSQIENGRVEPSIAVLRKLASYYKVLLVYFFDTDPVDNIVVRKDERKKIGRAGSPLVYELLQNNLNNKKMEAVIMKLSAHYKDPDGYYMSHVGEECIFVLKGTLKFLYETEVYILNEGDCIYYDCSRPFCLANPTDEETEILGFCTPPHPPELIQE